MSQRDSGPSPETERVVSLARATLRNVDFRKARFDSFSLTGCLFLACAIAPRVQIRVWATLERAVRWTFDPLARPV